ncbi:hypothetical protein Hanom_Chr12g01124751 [Helianthus anomalus]
MKERMIFRKNKKLVTIGIIKLWIMKGARGVGVGGYTVILFVFRWSEMKFKWTRRRLDFFFLMLCETRSYFIG